MQVKPNKIPKLVYRASGGRGHKNAKIEIIIYD